ncbi:MAG: choice-of-anchor D domain-containing protein [bacterium]
MRAPSAALPLLLLAGLAVGAGSVHDERAGAPAAASFPGGRLASITAASPRGRAASISVAPPSLDFGPVLVGALVRDTVTVTNDGTTDLVLGAPVVDDPAFAIGGTGGGVPAGTIVTAGHSLPIEVAFRPLVAGAVSASLLLSSNDPVRPEVTVPLSGAGAGGPLLSVQPPSFTVALTVGQTAQRTLTIQNQGETALAWTISIQPAVGLRGLNGVRVLWDRSKGQSGTLQWSTVVGDLRAQGATVQEVLPQTGDAITPQLLSGARVYVSEDVTSDWSVAERTAIANWVEAGGGVLLIGDNGVSIARYNALLTAIGSQIRMLATNGTNQAVITGSRIIAHPMTAGVSRLWVGVGVRTLSTPTPAVTVILDNADRPLVGAEVVGVGRVAVCGDELFNDVTIQEAGGVSADNHVFGTNTFGYLAGDLWIRPDSVSGSLGPALSTSIGLTFDPGSLPAGEYDLAVRVSANDPLHPYVDVPAHLSLTGFPEIGVSPPSLSFGGVEAGTSDTKKLVVRNTGSQQLTVTSVTSSAPTFSALPTAFSLSPAAAESLTVTFTPDSVGPFAATLTIASNAQTNPSLPVPVGGNGLVNCALPCNPPSLRPADVSATHDYSFWLDVALAGAPRAIQSFGFQLTYDAHHLVFLDSTKAEGLSAGFVVLAQQNEPGRLTCGGFGTTPIPSGSTGTLVRLKFNAPCDTCAAGSTSEIRVIEPIEDLAGVRPCCSTLTIAECPFGDGDVNSDGALTANDALCALKIFLNGQILPADAVCQAPGSCEVEAADANCDSLVTPGDALSIYERVLCVVDPTPLPCLANADPNPCGTAAPRGGTPALAWGTPRRGEAGEWIVPLLAPNGAPRAAGLEIALGGASVTSVRAAATAGWTDFEGRVSGDGTLRVGGYGAGSNGAGGVADASSVGSARGAGGEVASLVLRADAGGSVLRILAAHDVAFEGPREVSLGSPALADGLAILGAMPTSGPVAFDVGVATAGAAARLDVHDVTGRRVRTLGTSLTLGRARVVWDGRDDAGRAVAAGIYFVRLEVGERGFVRRVVLVR